MQVYIESNLIYNFDRQKTFRAGYMARNSRSSQEHRGHDENGIGQGSLLSAKSKWDKNHQIVFLWPRGQTRESTYFLSYNCHTANLGIDSEFNYEL